MCNFNNVFIVSDRNLAVVMKIDRMTVLREKVISFRRIEQNEFGHTRFIPSSYLPHTILTSFPTL